MVKSFELDFISIANLWIRAGLKIREWALMRYLRTVENITRGVAFEAIRLSQKRCPGIFRTGPETFCARLT